MSKQNIKKSVFSSIRNNFIAGIVVLIPIGITLYLTLFIIRISGRIIPKEINPNNYLLLFYSTIAEIFAIQPSTCGKVGKKIFLDLIPWLGIRPI